MQLSFLDISRAYFNAKVDSDSTTYVALPEEEPDHTNMCALQRRHIAAEAAHSCGGGKSTSFFAASSRSSARLVTA